ncbi:MAG: hypothetical protein NVS9B1_00770 [Candidatus Dormibacteraceae bacterium]
MRAVLTKIGRDIQRRRMQTAVVALITLLAGAMATISLTLVVRSTAPYDDAFDRVSGAHLVFHLDAAKVGPEAIRATGALPVVTAAGEPRPIAFVPFERGTKKATLQVVGRDDPGGRLERIQLAAGRWVQRPGEIVVTHISTPDIGQVKMSIGDTVYALSRPERPAFKVVGEAIDVNETTERTRAWVRSSEVAGLTDGLNSRPGFEMAYRVRHAETDAGLAGDAQAIQDALPAGAGLVPATRWLDLRRGFTWIVNIISTALLAFTGFALIASGLIVANAIAGAVIGSRREIGIMKAVGFTPAEVVQVYVGQMVIGAAIGAAFGVGIGILACQPLLNTSASSLGLPPQSGVYLPVDLAVFVGVLAVVALAALIPAIRAGSINPVEALAVGLNSPTPGRAWLGRLLQRAGLPRPVSVGVDDAFLRPMRGVLTVIALVIGVATLTFAIGFRTTAENAVADRASMGLNFDAGIARFGAYPDSSVMDTLRGRPETDLVVATASPEVSLAGIKEPVRATAIRGDATQLGFKTYRGRWFAGPGEAIVGPVTFAEAGLALGQLVAVEVEGHHAQLRIVGVYSDFTVYDGRGIRFDWATYEQALPDAQPSFYEVRLRPGADAGVYAAAVQATEPHFLHSTAVDVRANDSIVQLFEAIMGVPALLLVVIAIVGVFNTMLLNSRERSVDIAILKAIGMSGRQVMVMVVAPAVILGLLGAAVGAPAGIQLHRAIIQSMTESIGGSFEVAGTFGFVQMALVVLGGVGAAVIGALLPALWAARSSVAMVLRAE